MAPGLHDPRSSRAVLIGTHAYDHLPDLPAVADNLSALRTALTDPLVWGLPDGHCTVVEQPASADDVLEAVAEAASAASDLLLVYFAGHGLLSPVDDGLDLALRGSRHDQRFRRLGYESVRGVLRDARHIRAKAVVLDCCFAGRAIVGAMGPPVELADISQVEGTYLLAAASATEAALAPPGETHTAFTGELLDILANGIAGADPYLDFGRIHDHLSARLTAKGRPRPQQRNDGHGSRIVLARNRRAVTEADESNTGPTGPLRDLLVAQQRAASKFPYRLYGAPANALATVYVRQQTRAYVSERDRTTATTEPDDRRDAGPVARDPRDPSGRPDSFAPERHHSEPVPTTPRPTVARSATVAPLRAVDEALALHRHLLILGGPGQGKSTLTLQLAASLATEFAPDGIVPLRVTAAKLADLDGPWNARVERALTDELGPFLDGPLPADLLACLPAEHTRLLIVDGLDEITNPEQRRAFIAMLGSRLQDQEVPYRLLITSRPLPPDELESLNQLALGAYTLEPFSREQLAEFAGRWFGDTPQGRLRAQAFLHQIGRTGVRELSRVPLLATIAAIVFTKGAAETVPTSRFRLYEQYFAYLDRDQTAAHHLQKERILDGLRHAREVHVRSVSYLFAHVRELVEHVAESVVKVRDADAEPRDLLRTALSWLDGQGCRPTRLQLPQWQSLVAGFLGASGLFVLQGDRLRFVHYTFAEHIAADVRARRMPPEFSPEDTAWEELIDEALAANMQAWAVVVHHSNMHASGDAILNWLNGGGARYQALAGTFLANGIEADESHASRFVDHVLHRLANKMPQEESRQIVGDIAAMVQHPEMRTAIDRYLREEYRSYDMQIEIARAIGPDAVHIAEPVLAAVMRNADAPGRHRVAAARSLAELAPRHLGDATDIVRTLSAAERSIPGDRATAAEALADLDPRFTDEAADILREVLRNSNAGWVTRADAARSLVGLGPRYVDEAAAELGTLSPAPEVSCFEIAYAATALAELGSDHALTAAELLRVSARGRDQDDHMTLAEAMLHCGPKGTHDAAQLARGVAESPDAETLDLHRAAELLESLGHASEAAAIFVGIAGDRHNDVEFRAVAVLGASRLDAAFADEAAEILQQLALDEDTAARERALAAVALVTLSRAHRDGAVALLRAEMRSPESTPEHRIAFAGALGELSPAYTSEATGALHELALSIPPLHLDVLARALADLGAQNSEAAAGLFRTVIAHPHASARDRVSSGNALAGLGAAYLGEAAAVLREAAAAGDADHYVRSQAAVHLAGLAPRHIPEAAAMLLAVVSDEGVETWMRDDAARELAELECPLADSGTARLLESLCRARKRAHATVSTARQLARLAPRHTSVVAANLRERMAAPHTPVEDAVVLGSYLASTAPESTEGFADFLRGVVRSGETTPYARRCAVQALGSLRPGFRDEAVALGDIVLSADDVPNEIRWMVIADRADWGPRLRRPALDTLRRARCDRTVTRRERRELAGKFRDFGTAGLTESAVLMLEIFTDTDTPDYLRGLAAREVPSSSPRRVREVARRLRRSIADAQLPLLDRVKAIDVLLAVDPYTGPETGELLPDLLESTPDAPQRIAVAQVCVGAGGYVRDIAVEAMHTILADATADPSEHLGAAEVLFLGGPRLRDETAQAFRAIASAPHATLEVRSMAAYRLADSAPRFEDEGVALLRALYEGAGTARAAALIANRLEYVGEEYRPEAAALLLRTVRDAAAPAYVRATAAGRLAYHGPVNRTEAIAVLREIVAAPDTPRRTRRMAAGDLGQFGVSCAAEAADVLFGMAAASPPRSVARRAALRTVARIGHGYARRALAELDALGAESPSYCQRTAPAGDATNATGSPG